MTSWLQLRWQKLYARIGLVSWVLLTVIQAGLLQDSCCASFIPFHNLCLNEASKYRVDWDPLSVPTQIPKIIAGWISAWVYVLAEFVISCHFDSFASELAGELVGRPRGHIPPLSTTEFAPKLGGCACSKPWFSPHVQNRMNDMHCPPILLNFSAFIHYPLLCSSLINLINSCQDVGSARLQSPLCAQKHTKASTQLTCLK